MSRKQLTDDERDGALIVRLFIAALVAVAAMLASIPEPGSPDDPTISGTVTDGGQQR
jgi:hypothetical protein